MSSVVRKIPSAIRDDLVERLVDLFLNSPKGDKMPSGLAKNILFYWQRDMLTSDVGLASLIEAALVMEPEEAAKLLEVEFNLKEAAEEFRKLIPQAQTQ